MNGKRFPWLKQSRRGNSPDKAARNFHADNHQSCLTKHGFTQDRAGEVDSAPFCGDWSEFEVLLLLNGRAYFLSEGRS